MEHQERDALVEHYRSILEGVYGGRRWIISTGVLVAQARLCQTLHELGATQMLCVAGAMGAGSPPDAQLAPTQIVLNTQGHSMMDSIRTALDAMANLSPEHCAQIDAFDPQHTARVIGDFYDDGQPVGERAMFGAREASWSALEDKLIIDALWDECDIPRAPCAIAQSSPAALLAAHAELDEGLGTVWAGDNREGFHGGAEYVRWVRREQDQPEALRFFAERCDTVRVMPFLEGIPCSIHGFVFEDYVVALRPCEMLVFRKRHDNKLHYSSAATYWDPPAPARAQMRAMTKRVGEHLRQTLGYRGAFTVDGVMSARGFLPTELNPRYGAALGVLASGLPELPLTLLNLAVVEGVEASWRPEKLEELLLSVADEHRAGGPLVVSTTRLEQTHDFSMTWRGDHYEVNAQDVEDADVRGFIGPNSAGSFARLRFAPRTLALGGSLALQSVLALRALDAHFGLGIGELEPARDQAERSTTC